MCVCVCMCVCACVCVFMCVYVSNCDLGTSKREGVGPIWVVAPQNKIVFSFLITL
jgi:hypothetical protein